MTETTKTKIINVIRLTLRMLMLDLDFLSCRFPQQLADRLFFLASKYFLLAKYLVFKKQPILGKSRMKIGNRFFYYDSVYGIANFQSMNVLVNKRLSHRLSSFKNPLIIDVGAHIGNFSIPLAHLLKNSRIYALEPVSLTFNLLKLNCQSLNRIRLHKIGLAAKTTASTIYFNKQYLTYSSLIEKKLTSLGNLYSEPVKLETLDNFCQKQGIRSVSLLKIDTEGTESEVLKGAHRTLSRTHFLLLECTLDKQSKYTFSSLIKHLSTSGSDFQLLYIDNLTLGPSGEIYLFDMLLENKNL